VGRSQTNRTALPGRFFASSWNLRSTWNGTPYKISSDNDFAKPPEINGPAQAFVFDTKTVGCEWARANVTKHRLCSLFASAIRERFLYALKTPEGRAPANASRNLRKFGLARPQMKRNHQTARDEAYPRLGLIAEYLPGRC
jgi:hypothetical protein